MIRLKKLASADYTMIGKVHFTSFNNVSDEQEDRDYEGKNYISELNAALREEFSEMGQKGLAEYIDYEYENLEDELILSIVTTARQSGNDIYSITKIKTTRELTDEEKEKVKDYIVEQFSDGFGEGFEQNEIATIREECEVYEPGYYDENDEWVEEETIYEDATVDIYAHLWTMNTEYSFE